MEFASVYLSKALFTTVRSVRVLKLARGFKKIRVNSREDYKQAELIKSLAAQLRIIREINKITTKASLVKLAVRNKTLER